MSEIANGLARPLPFETDVTEAWCDATSQSDFARPAGLEPIRGEPASRDVTEAWRDARTWRNHVARPAGLEPATPGLRCRCYPPVVLPRTQRVRINEGGEAWVYSMLWRDEEAFPLREALLLKHGAVESTPEYSVFESASIPAVRPGQLEYFAASIFWRGAAHVWRLHGSESTRLAFGSYEEEFRRYLLGAAWPANAVLFVYVSAGMDSLRNTVTMWPSLQAVNDEFTGYCFAVPGVIFWLWLGALPYDMLGTYSASSAGKYVYISDEFDIRKAEKGLSELHNAKKVGALAKKGMQGPTLTSPWPLSRITRRKSRSTT